MKVEAAIRQHLANVGAGAGVGRVSRSIQNAVRAAVAAGRHHEQLRGAGLAARCGSGVGRGGAGESPARHWGEVRLSGRKRDGAMRESTERSESACHRQVAATVRTRAGKPGTGSATGSRGRALPSSQAAAWGAPIATHSGGPSHSRAAVLGVQPRVPSAREQKPRERQREQPSPPDTVVACAGPKARATVEHGGSGERERGAGAAEGEAAA